MKIEEMSPEDVFRLSTCGLTEEELSLKRQSDQKYLRAMQEKGEKERQTILDQMTRATTALESIALSLDRLLSRQITS